MSDHRDDTGLSQLTWGKIASVDLRAGRVTVALGDVETQAIRWATGGSGGTRVWTRPKVGEQVMVLAPEGDIVGAIAIRGLDCTAFPPVGDSDREMIQFEDGAVLAYNPDTHALEVVLPAGATAAIIAPGGVTITADVKIAGDVEIEGKLSATGQITSDDDVKAGTVSLKHHKHLGVSAGAAISGEPQT